MKKLITAAMALALFAGMASAQVSSENVVGYSTLTLQPGYNMIAVNWDVVGAPAAGISVQDLFDTSALKGGLAVSLGDNIKIHDAATGGFATLYLYDGGETTYHDNDGLWMEAGSPSTRVLANGEAFWFLSRASVATNVAVAGQVPVDASVTKTVLPGYNMFGSGFTADMEINGTYDWAAAGAIGGLAVSLGDNIKIHDAVTGGFSTLYLYDGGETTYHDNDGLWMEAGTPSSRVIPVGQGFWYYSRGTNPAGWSWAEVKPYTL